MMDHKPFNAGCFLKFRFIAWFVTSKHIPPPTAGMHSPHHQLLYELYWHPQQAEIPSKHSFRGKISK